MNQRTLKVPLLTREDMTMDAKLKTLPYGENLSYSRSPMIPSRESNGVHAENMNHNQDIYKPLQESTSTAISDLFCFSVRKKLVLVVV